VTYALCGFCNLPSIAIQIGGLTALAPERRAEFVSLGPRAMVAGALACWSTACAAALFL
jgi:CNT family concentrative nucleoside transporter